jgi:nitrate/TMAO reductase-like tetraheme cytochrome c subunit
MAKFTYEDYCILSYIGYGRGKAISDMTQKNLSGYMDYYYRMELTQKEIDASLERLLRQGIIQKASKRYVATDFSKKMHRQFKNIKTFILEECLSLSSESEDQFEEAFLSL